MNCSKPLVSVVIPMYNVANYIQEAINSVLAQDYERLEIICIDDGSPDNTVHIVNQYTDPRIKLVRQSNRGLSGARNTGIYEARGKYIALLDADDRWHPKKISAHVKHLEASPKVGCSYSPSLFIDEHGEETGLGQYPKLMNISRKHLFCRNPIGNGSAPVLRRTVFEDIAFKVDARLMYFDESLRQSEDIECWTRIALKTKWQFEGIDKAYTYYRLNMGGLSANLDKQLASWEAAMAKLSISHSGFFNEYYDLALAYQYRYLARRAIQAKNKKSSFMFLRKAIMSDARILSEEPVRTITTFACALCSLLPYQFYNVLEASAIRCASTVR